jgi:hypothetical protein
MDLEDTEKTPVQSPTALPPIEPDADIELLTDTENKIVTPPTMSLPPASTTQSPPIFTTHIHAQPHSHANARPKRRQKKIAILTSGGDSAGMNAAGKLTLPVSW